MGTALAGCRAYADSNGQDENLAYVNAFRYRDYVVDAFNSDKPYDQFVREQVAGDLLPASTDQEHSERLVATGFLTLGPKMLAEDDPVKMQMDIVDEQLDTMGGAFLGMTFGEVDAAITTNSIRFRLLTIIRSRGSSRARNMDIFSRRHVARTTAGVCRGKSRPSRPTPQTLPPRKTNSRPTSKLRIGHSSPRRGWPITSWPRANCSKPRRWNR